MAITEIIRFGDRPSSMNSESNVVIQEAIEALRESKRARHESLGVEVLVPGAVQITAEWDDDHQFHPGSSPITDTVHEYLGQPNRIFHVALNEPGFGPDGPATANIIEFAANYFPVSRLTTGFKEQIEADFLRFDDLCSKGLKGNSGLSYGWVSEEQTHPNVEGEKVVCFLIIRGWESFDHFQQCTKSEAYNQAIPVLYAWNAPYEIWHIERKS